jgi:ParB family chromosome partitioning protein
VTDPRDPDPRIQRPQGRPSGAGKKALGKGLGALIGESRAALGRSAAAPALGEGRLRELPLTDISVNRRQPRRTFADDELQELAASIRALGVVQPVVVRPLQAEEPATEGAPAVVGVRFELIAGERRLRASPART